MFKSSAVSSSSDRRGLSAATIKSTVDNVLLALQGCVDFVGQRASALDATDIISYATLDCTTPHTTIHYTHLVDDRCE